MRLQEMADERRLRKRRSSGTAIRSAIRPGYKGGLRAGSAYSRIVARHYPHRLTPAG
jgi:hypothetical protein